MSASVPTTAIDAVKKAEDEISPLLNSVREIDITTQEEADTAGAILREIADHRAAIAEVEKGILVPMRVAIGQVQDLFGKPRDVLATAERELRQKLAAYIAEETKRREAEAKEREQLAGMFGKTSAGTLAAPPAPPKVKGVSSVKRWKYEVEDEAKVPREFLAVDRGAIKRAVDGGAREIAGVRIFQEETVRRS